jgi:hypothetical protein
VSLPYARTGSVDVSSINPPYSCVGPTTGCVAGFDTSWTETATAGFDAGITSGFTPTTSGWTPAILDPYTATVTYGGSPPPPCVPGQCGAANGVAVASAPTVGLCAVGTQSAVFGTGPWNWSCAGSDGGTTASCDAPADAVNGACGAANGASVSGAPAVGLCSTGTASAVSGSGPWTWTCTGLYGGTTASCAAVLESGSCVITPFGSTCATSASEAIAHLYLLTPITGYGYEGETGAVSLLTAADIIPNEFFYATNVDVPIQQFSTGFPGYPDLTTWFGVCYDGGWSRR